MTKFIRPINTMLAPTTGYAHSRLVLEQTHLHVPLSRNVMVADIGLSLLSSPKLQHQLVSHTNGQIVERRNEPLELPGNSLSQSDAIGHQTDHE